MNLPDDYFLDTDDKMLEYLENQAKDSINEIQQSNEANREKAYKLLNYLLFGIGSLVLLLINNAKNISPVIIVYAIFLMAAWTTSAYMLTHYVILSKKRPMLANLPQHLYNTSFKESNEKNKLGVLRRYELHNSNQTIIDLQKINSEYSKHTDRAIMLAILSPIFLVILTAIFLKIFA